VSARRWRGAKGGGDGGPLKYERSGRQRGKPFTAASRRLRRNCASAIRLGFLSERKSCRGRNRARGLFSDARKCRMFDEPFVDPSAEPGRTILPGVVIFARQTLR